jgi:hypothetical protein
MKFHPSTAAVGVLFALVCVATQAEPASPGFPGNEAVRMVKRQAVVEAPPLTAETQALRQRRGKAAPAFCHRRGLHDRKPAGLDGVPRIYLSRRAAAFLPASGRASVSRLWTVKLGGVWQHCDSRAASRKCEPVAAGAPGGDGNGGVSRHVCEARSLVQHVLPRLRRSRVRGPGYGSRAGGPCAGHHLHSDLRPRSDARRGVRAGWHFRLEDGQGWRDPVLRFARAVLQRQCCGLGYRPAGRLGRSVCRTQSGRSRHRVRRVGLGQHGGQRATCPALERRGHVSA